MDGERLCMTGLRRPRKCNGQVKNMNIWAGIIELLHVMIGAS
jgi:hypothetical protein